MSRVLNLDKDEEKLALEKALQHPLGSPQKHFLCVIREYVSRITE